MSSPVAELEAGLQAMLGLKPPGVSGSRITGITTLCVNNVEVRKKQLSHERHPSDVHLRLCFVLVADMSALPASSPNRFSSRNCSHTSRGRQEPTSLEFSTL